MRKHNYIEAYYDEFGTLEGKSNSRLFPHANYQSMLYANFEGADQENVVGASFYLDDGTQKNELPMKFVGYFYKDDKRYARWELPIPSDIVEYFKPDRETQMSVKFLEYKPFDFEGFYDVYSDLPTGDDAPEDDAIAYVLQEEDGNEEGLYQYDEENNEWNETEEPTIEHAEVIWASALFDVTVSRSFRIEREPVDVDSTDIIFQTIAKLQSDLYNLIGTTDTDGKFDRLHLNEASIEDLEEAGQLIFDGTRIKLKENGFIHTLGGDLYGVFRNNTDEEIPELTPVMINDEDSSTGEHLNIKKADPEKWTWYLGLTHEAISKNDKGVVVTHGTLVNVDTSDFNEGEPLYIDIENDGALTQTRPTEGYVIVIGVVQRSHPDRGSIKVDNRIDFDNIYKYTDGVVETNNENKTSFWVGTQDEYDNLSEYDDNTIYLIEEDE